MCAGILCACSETHAAEKHKRPGVFWAFRMRFAFRPRDARFLSHRAPYLRDCGGVGRDPRALRFLKTREAHPSASKSARKRQANTCQSRLWLAHKGRFVVAAPAPVAAPPARAHGFVARSLFGRLSRYAIGAPKRPELRFNHLIFLLGAGAWRWRLPHCASTAA